MDVQNIGKLIEMYTMQKAYANTDDSSSSNSFDMIFNTILSELSKDDNSTSSTSSSNSSDILNSIKSASNKYGVDSDLIKAVISQESSFNPHAVSSSGAMGLMQLMPDTAKSLGVDNPFDALENINGGTMYLKNLINKFNGNTELALSAYNGGIGRMDNLGVDSSDKINLMPDETINYVKQVVDKYNSYKDKTSL